MLYNAISHCEISIIYPDIIMSDPAIIWHNRCHVLTWKRHMITPPISVTVIYNMQYNDIFIKYADIIM